MIFKITNLTQHFNFMDVRLSDAEKIFVIHGAQQGLRSDGRSNLDYRPIILETGVLSTTNGSARVRLGSTDLLIGIKADLIVVDDMPSYKNRLNFTVDCSANAAPQFAGRGGEEFGIEIASALSAAYDNSYVLPDLKKLIVSPMHAWKLFVDIVKAALYNTEICNVVVRPGDAGKQVVDLPDDNTVWRFDISRTPFILCVSKLGGANVMDVSLTEKACVKATLWVGISVEPTKVDLLEVLECYNSTALASHERNCRITFLRQCGGGSLETDSIEGMVSCAVQTAFELQAAFNNRLMDIERDESHALSTFLT
ncbi:unnamed protein product [Enterobius vermicularis]|uniref:Ribosomal RNA-processing protein 42 n=1 Tax=Enterobius vermicularis TaxID=51028 RepID=A0A0N4V167_ENTVE|nr:unnamed protein product [Enterobius vermicularis]